MTALLPAAFADLEPFAAVWCLPTEAERYARRLATPMSDIQAFYDAATPRAEAALAHCDLHPLDDLPDDVLRLMHLLYSLVTISFCVEAWSQQRVPDTGAATLDCLIEPVP
ncbi:hypothetical protein [Actinocorallia longicatena]|uniref:Uncharacterized protein n=1 Tax=Actinocorallia longicatena TaxID=111803 RepID=A0ABP6Q6P7_9ACTN